MKSYMKTRDIISLAIVIIMLFGGFWTAMDIKGDVRELRGDVGELREDVGDLRERMARVETLLEQLVNKDKVAMK